MFVLRGHSIRPGVFTNHWWRGFGRHWLARTVLLGLATVALDVYEKSSPGGKKLETMIALGEALMCPIKNIMGSGSILGNFMDNHAMSSQVGDRMHWEWTKGAANGSLDEHLCGRAGCNVHLHIGGSNAADKLSHFKQMIPRDLSQDIIT